MSSLVIESKNLTKTYRLYRKPHHRFLDMFGLLRKNNGAYTEYSALNGINMTISRGEKVAIIGRNGAGKSTFLKIVSKIIEPSAGHITVRGQVHALLSIGAGFHPDFTGRENVFSYLEHMGVTGDAANRKLHEIIHFAEIEQYIDQPIKTYSTGMGARLMFSASTAIAPDILIIDEVLGVGDAYFTRKSFDRMKELCDSEGTTLLLVTHDVYAASAFCDRMIWIDRGRIVMDEKSDIVVKAYEVSIRLQEEDRLRQRTLSANKKTNDKGNTDDTIAYFQIVTENRIPIEENLPIYSIKLFSDNQLVNEISMESGSGVKCDGYTKLVLKYGEGNWSEPYERDGKWTRDFQTFGSIFQRAPFIFGFANDMQLSEKKITLEIGFIDTIRQPCYLEFYCNNGQSFSTKIDAEGDQRQRIFKIPINIDISNRAVLTRPSVFGLESQEDIAKLGDKFGSKRLAINSIQIEDGNGHEKIVFNPYEDMDILVNFRVMDSSFSDKPTILTSIHKEGSKISTRLISQNFLIQKNDKGCEYYVVRVKLRPCLLGPGTYSVGVGLFDHDYFNKCYGRHFAENPMVLDRLTDAIHFEIKSRDDDWNYYLLEYIQPAEWSLETAPLF